jgi:hypothetical protein
VGVSSVPGGEATAAAGTGLIATGAAAPQQHEAPAPAGFEPESFDAVLLDAPCSGLGLRPRLTQSATLTYLRQVGYGGVGWERRGAVHQQSRFEGPPGTAACSQHYSSPLTPPMSTSAP